MQVPSMYDMAEVMARSGYTEETVFDLGITGGIVFLVVVPEVGACRVPDVALSHFMAGADEHAADGMPEHWTKQPSGPWKIKRDRLRILADSWEQLADSSHKLRDAFERQQADTEAATMRIPQSARKPGFYTLEEAAQAIAKQLGWHDGARDTLQNQLMQAARIGQLTVRHPHTDLPYRPDPVRHFHEQVTPADVNEWAARLGVYWRWEVVVPEPQAAPVAIVGASDGVEPGRARRDSLTPVIEHAQSECRNRADTAEVWAALMVMANNTVPPFLRTENVGLAYLSGDGVKYFTRDALDKRLHPEKRGAPGKRR